MYERTHCGLHSVCTLQKVYTISISGVGNRITDPGLSTRSKGEGCTEIQKPRMESSNRGQKNKKKSFDLENAFDYFLLNTNNDHYNNSEAIKYL